MRGMWVFEEQKYVSELCDGISFTMRKLSSLLKSLFWKRTISQFQWRCRHDGVRLFWLIKQSHLDRSRVKKMLLFFFAWCLRPVERRRRRRSRREKKDNKRVFSRSRMVDDDLNFINIFFVFLFNLLRIPVLVAATTALQSPSLFLVHIFGLGVRHGWHRRRVHLVQILQRLVQEILQGNMFKNRLDMNICRSIYTFSPLRYIPIINF